MKEQRNYGIDLLRIVSMFLIVIIHLLGHGGVLRNAVEGTMSFKIVWLIEIMSFCAVNVFALISGYVGYDKSKGFLKRFIKLYLQVFFYSIGLFLLVSLLKNRTININELIKYCLPIIFNIYWYVTAYFGLLLIMPLLNKGIANSDDKDLKRLVILIILFFSIINIFTKSFNVDNGYSVIWLALLYIVGGAIKKTNAFKKIKIYQSLLIIAAMIGITYYIKIYGKDILILGLNIEHGRILNYVSPTILIIALMLINVFSKIKIPNVSRKIIAFLSSSSFAIYLLNDHPLVREQYIKNSFLFLLDLRIIKAVMFIVIFAVLFMISSVLIDKVRLLLFKLLHINNGVDALLKKHTQLSNK